MTKIIQEEIDSCAECPYFIYDYYCNIGKDSGYECTKTAKRICDDWEIRQYEEGWTKWSESQKTLFPLEVPTIKNPFEIPSWCELKDKYDS